MAPHRRAIIHIGVEKTGTTSIQRFLAANRETLKARGCCYPLSLGRENHIRLCGLAQSPTPRFPTIHNILQISGPEARNEFMARTKRELDEEIGSLPASVDTLIFSNEHLHSNLLEQEETENLRRIVGAYADEVRIVAYLRRQDELSVSLFSTRIKGGEGWKNVFPPVDGPTSLPYYFDYDAILRNYATAFGEDNITPRLFSRQKLKDGDLVTDFLDAAGIPFHDSLIRIPRLNESLSRNALYVLSLLNRTVPCWSGGKWNVNRDNLVEILEEKFSYSEPLTSRDEVEAFYNNFRPSNERVRLRYFPQLPTLFDEDFSKYPSAGNVLPTVEEITDIFSILWNRRSEIARKNHAAGAEAAANRVRAEFAAKAKAEAEAKAQPAAAAQ
jgi:hypothetical protein